MTDIPAEALSFNMYYAGASPIPDSDEAGLSLEEKAKRLVTVPPITEETPSFRDIHIRNILCKGAGQAALLQGLPEMNLLNVDLENVCILDAKQGIYCQDAEGIRMKNMTIQTVSGPAITFRNAKDVRLEGFAFTESVTPAVNVLGSRTGNMRFRRSDFQDVKQQIHTDPEVSTAAVQFEQD